MSNELLINNDFVLSLIAKRELALHLIKESKNQYEQMNILEESENK